MTELKPCPFCGYEALVQPTYDIDTNECDGFFAWCSNYDCECKPQTGDYPTEAEAIAAWNTRAAYEMDGFFYLPKPKQQLFSYTTGFTFDDLSLKATGSVDVYALVDAVREWQEEELNKHIVERICEVFKPEWTSVSVFDGNMDGTSICSECGGEFPQDPDRRWRLNYCPNCGARVVDA